MTKAVIRPDYFSGPAMAEDFGDFGMILRAADAGIVILDPNVLVPIFKADYWVFDDTVPWRFTRASEELLDSLDQNNDREIVFLSPDLEKFSSLHSLCEKRNAEVKNALAMATIPNVAAIGAAVVLSSPALVSVVMTTLGAATCYYRASRLLRQAAGR
jgi:hypothetical protein